MHLICVHVLMSCALIGIVIDWPEMMTSSHPLAIREIRKL